jgi:hypothetical protein
MALYNLGVINGIKVEYLQTGDEAADTFVTLTGSGGKKLRGKWGTYDCYLDTYVGHNFVASLKSYLVKEAEDWLTFEKANKRDLAELERLTKKLKGVSP